MFTKLTTKVDSQEMRLPIVLVKIQNISVPRVPAKPQFGGEPPTYANGERFSVFLNDR